MRRAVGKCTINQAADIAVEKEKVEQSENLNCEERM